MKYRIFHIGKHFIPQYRKFWLWRNFKERRVGRGVCGSGEWDELIAYDNLYDARQLIAFHIARRGGNGQVPDNVITLDGPKNNL